VRILYIMVAAGAIALVGMAVVYRTLRTDAALETRSNSAQPAQFRGVPAAKFRFIHALRVQEGDGTTSYIRRNLARETCFTAADADADGMLRVDMYLLPPRGVERYSIADMSILYKAVLSDRGGRMLWKGSARTLQPVVGGPGVHLPDGLYTTISPEKAEDLLLGQLATAACTQL
jgi:hypothetical protein